MNATATGGFFNQRTGSAINPYANIDPKQLLSKVISIVIFIEFRT